MTGHFLYGNWNFENDKWISKKAGPIKNDPQNRFIHLVLDLSNGKQLALSDLRKFAKVLLWPTDKLSELEDVNNLGPDPTDKDFDFKKFQERLANKKGRIKTVLMDQTCLCRHRQYLFRRDFVAVRNSSVKTGFVFNQEN